MKYIIYYADGSTYEGEPQLAPKRGVIAILQKIPDDPNWHVLQEVDFYLWREDWHGGIWQGADLMGKTLYELDPGWKLPLFGESVPGDLYDEIIEAALDYRRKLNKALE